MNVGGEQLTAGIIGFAVIGVCISLFFEFINGFHDTANAVATVIYTHSLPPTVAVIWSGIWNFQGVLLSTGTVAYSVVAILPPSLVLNVSSGTGAAALFALLLGAVVWNFGTWYFGMPCSSSHSLIGSMLGVSLIYTFTHSKQGEGIHWDQAGQVLLSLLISPIIGFGVAALMLWALHKFVKTPALFEPADPEKSPPHWVRGLLIVTCTGVSFAHGSNDGQKGMGLLMLVLMVALPSSLALNSDMKPAEFQRLTNEIGNGIQYFAGKVQAKTPLKNEDAKTKLTEYNTPKGEYNEDVFPPLIAELSDLRDHLAGKNSVQEIPLQDRTGQRQSAFLAQQTLIKLEKEKRIGAKDLDALQNGPEEGGRVHPDLGKSRCRARFGPGYHDRMAPHRDHHRGANWEHSFGLCARCRRRIDDDGNHLPGRQFRASGQHHPRPDFRDCRNNVCEPIRSAEKHSAEYPPRAGCSPCRFVFSSVPQFLPACFICSLTYWDGNNWHLGRSGHFQIPERNSLARSGQQSIAQGLPWVNVPTEISPEGAS